MKYQNNTSSSVLLPVAGEGTNPTSWIKFKAGDIKDVPEKAIESAEVQGLTKVIEEVAAPVVVETPEVSSDKSDEKSDDVDMKDDEKVEAETSSIGKTKVETKQKKGA